NGMLAGYVYVDITGRDVGGYVADAKKAVAASLKLPTGYSLVRSGQYENMQRVKERLKIVLPVTILLIFLLLYANTKSTFTPMVGGMFTSFIMELLVYPAIYLLWKWNTDVKPSLLSA